MSQGQDLAMNLARASQRSDGSLLGVMVARGILPLAKRKWWEG